jgi:pimeloyl-ACP methyl ester carboxylesterase
LGLKLLEAVTVETGPNPTFSIIWMHGLGADGHDFEPLVPELLDRGMPALRFVFPHAPVRPVTINNGYEMRAWYDIIGIDKRSTEDFAGIAGSAEAIGHLVRREAERGIVTARIVIAGFSQGGAMALHIAMRHPEKFAGVIALAVRTGSGGPARLAEAGLRQLARRDHDDGRRLRHPGSRLSSYRQMFTVAATFSDSMAPVPAMVKRCARKALIWSRGSPRASLPKT